MDSRSKINKFPIEGSKSLSLIWGLVCLFLTLCILFPLFCVFITPNSQDFKYVFSSSIWKQAALNTVLECLCSTTLAVIIGFIYAYAVVKAKIPFARFFSMIPILHLITPPFVGGLSFILLLGRQGFITHTLLGLDVSLYGFWGLLIAQTLCFFPMAFMICSDTLKGINPALEQAGKALGASKIKTFFTITLPLASNGILAAFLFVAVSVMSDFGNPMIVAGRFRVLAVEIYTQLTGWMNAGTSAILGIILIIPSLILFILQNKMTKKNMAKAATIGTKIQFSQSEPASLPVRILLTVFCGFISICVIAQFLAIIAGSFQKLWGINTAFTWNHVKNLARCKLELKNTITFSLIAALLSTLIACLSAFLVYRTKCPLKSFIDITSQLPSAIPGTLFGLAFSIAANKLNFHHSGVMIVIAITVGFMPFSFRILSASYSQIKTTLDDGGRVLGASPLQILNTIILPITKDGIFDSFIYDFVRGVGTMSAVIFLVSFKTPLTSVKILNLAEQGFWGDAAALALLLTIITFAVIGIGKFIIHLWSRKNEK